MREIKFRGRDEQGRWHFGMLRQWRDQSFAIETTQGLAVDFVVPATVGQFTGLLDNNGKEIYEGDILKTKDETLGVAVVLWNDVGGGWSLNMMSDYADLNKHNVEALELKVVGTVYEAEEEGCREGLI